MSKDKTKRKEKQQNVVNVDRVDLKELSPIISNKIAFQSFQYQHRRRLYKKMNEFFMPKKTNRTMQGWFLYPEKDIPLKNKDYIVSVMTECISEIVNEIIDDLTITKAQTDELLQIFTKEIEDHEQSGKTETQIG